MTFPPLFRRRITPGALRKRRPLRMTERTAHPPSREMATVREDGFSSPTATSRHLSTFDDSSTFQEEDNPRRPAKKKPASHDGKDGSARAEYAQGTPAQSHVSPSVLEYSKIRTPIQGRDASRADVKIKYFCEDGTPAIPGSGGSERRRLLKPYSYNSTFVHF